MPLYVPPVTGSMVTVFIDLLVFRVQDREAVHELEQQVTFTYPAPAHQDFHDILSDMRLRERPSIILE